MSDKKYTLTISEDGDAAYLRFPSHIKGTTKVKKTISLQSLLPDYNGPDINLDFDSDNNILGIEILE